MWWCYVISHLTPEITVVTALWMEMKADTPLGALQKHLLEEEYPGRTGLSWQQRRVSQARSTGSCGLWLVEWSPALKSLGLNPDSELCQLSHAA